MNEAEIKLSFEIIGGILGIVAFFWNLFGYMWSYIFSHLQLDITNEKIVLNDKVMLKVNTIVENKGNVAKKVDFAFLLIKPENEQFINSLIQITKQHGFENKQNKINHFLNFLVNTRKKHNYTIIDKKFAVLPLPYFYTEQFQIGNEKVKYSKVIELNGYESDIVYNIRFIIVSRHIFNTYLRFRMTSDTFVNA